MIRVLFVFLLAVLLTSIFTLGFLRRGPWSSALGFFVIVFLAAWATSLWLGDIGPIVFGMYWIPTVFSALAVAALLAWRHIQRERQRDGPAAEVREARAHELAFDVVFWVMAVGLCIVILLGYLLAGPTFVPTP